MVLAANPHLADPMVVPLPMAGLGELLLGFHGVSMQPEACKNEQH